MGWTIIPRLRMVVLWAAHCLAGPNQGLVAEKTCSLWSDPRSLISMLFCGLVYESGALVLGLALYWYYRHNRDKMDRYAWTQDLQKSLLEEQELELAEMEEIWRVQEADFNLIRRIDTEVPGAFGEVGGSLNMQ